MTGFLLTQNEIGLFTISAVFGFGFGGLIPGYVLAVRELFPASEASWRIPTMLFPGSLGMAAGGWLAGVMYDHFAFYAPAFAVGVLFNLINLMVIGALVARNRADASGARDRLIRRPRWRARGLAAEPLDQLRLQHDHREGLGQMVVHSGGQARLPAAIQRMRGQCHDRRGASLERLELADRAAAS